MATRHGFCSVHHIAYDRTLDYVCPQCTIARIPPGKQLEYDASLQKPLDDSGKPLDPISLQPVG